MTQAGCETVEEDERGGDWWLVGDVHACIPRAGACHMR